METEEATMDSNQPPEGFEKAGVCVIEIFTIFKQYHRETQLQACSIFLCVAYTPGITMAEIERKTRCAQSTVWRNVNALSTESGLVVTQDDPADPRRKVVHLTKRGQKLANRLAELMGKVNHGEQLPSVDDALRAYWQSE